jgi:hypothetical protein
MEEAENTSGEQRVADTEHEAHEHAPKRLIVGVVAVVLVFVLGGVIWSRWGDTIEEVCFGEDECPVEAGAQSPEDTSFSTPAGYQF